MSVQFMKRSVAYIMSFLMTFYPLYPYADQMSDTGHDGQNFAQELVDGFNKAPSQISNGDISVPSMKDGVFDSTNATTINVNELFPGTSSSNQQGTSTYFPDGATPDVGSLQNASTDAGEMDKVGREFQKNLFNDANQDQPTTTTGTAYKVMMDSHNKSRPDMSSDPVFDMTKNVYTNIDAISKEFGDCSTSTTFHDISNTKRIPDYKTCERVVDKSTSCSVIHDIDADAPPVGFASEEFIHYGQRDIQYSWSPQVGNKKTLTISMGSSGMYSAGARYRFYVNNPSDYTAFYVSGNVHLDEAGVAWHRSPDGVNTVFVANNSYGWDAGNLSYYPNYGTMWGDYAPMPSNLLPLLKPGWNEIGVGIMNASHSGSLVLNLTLESKAHVKSDTWLPSSCIDAVKPIRDGFATGTIACTQSYEVTNNCTMVNDMPVCSDQLLPSPLPEVGQFCKTVQIDVKTDFYKGTTCHTDASGQQVCVESGSGPTDSCSKYETNPQCGYISQKCVDGAAAKDGTCYLMEEIWDCGTNVVVPDVESETKYECAGPVRCMGEDCFSPVKTQSSSFAQTAALLNAAQFMTQDMSCSTNGAGVADCKVFGGSPYTCKVAVAGVQDCCDVPTNTSAGTYITALLAVGKLDSAIMALDPASTIKGAYTTLRDPITDTVSEVTEPFTSYAENISSEVTEYFEPVTTYLDTLKQQISDAIDEALKDLLGDTANSMGATAAESGAGQEASKDLSEQAGEGMMQELGAAASTVMAVYTAYVVAVMVVQMIYKCEPEEFELATKKDTKSCHYAGSYCADEVLGQCLEKRESYCCYNSPLSRIINEQIRPQLARPFGDPKNPDCGGITVSEVGSIDWSKVDLGEWTALLTQFNLMPDPSKMTMDSITGSGSNLNRINGTRVDAGQRANTRLDGIDIDQKRRDAYDNTAVSVSGK